MIDAEFERARRKASWHRILSFVTGRPSLLLPFDLVRDAVDITSTFYGGIRDIELNRIIGSVNRYQDFDREFLPTRDSTAERWAHVRHAFEEGPGVAPIRVYQVGDAYFVLDGNHRVSVARQMGLETIEAEVTVLEPSVPFSRPVDAAAITARAGCAAFLRRTGLSERRPDQRIEFTLPGGYAVLLEHIAVHRYYLGLDEQREISYEEAAVSWYDHLYRPLIDILREEDMLRSFARRTEADLYVWIAEHLYYLREEFGDDVPLEAAAHDYLKMQKAPVWARVVAEWEERMGRRDGRAAPWRVAKSETRELRRVAARLDRLRRAREGLAYRVPRRWVDAEDARGGVVDVEAVEFWRDAIDRVLRAPSRSPREGAGGEWTSRSVIYNLYVRAGCAFDHDGDGALRSDGRVRETGTFLKAIAMLPYIRNLGCDVLHLLPITDIGADGRKGVLGSPYAIRDPYTLDDRLAEPLLELGAEVEFRALVEAAHRLGMRVVTEFVFRTAAKDSAWIADHPEWFYWIRGDVPDRAPGNHNEEHYGNPFYTEDELVRVRAAVAEARYDALPEPHAVYRGLFASAPPREAVMRVGHRYLARGEHGERLRIPGAFADWPPDDTQPPWGDVTYLRLYDHPDFDYIAYNTVRMYAAELARPERVVQPLWDKIVGILPHYIKTFGIDGAMIDMGHALPLDLKRRIIDAARRDKPDFAFWDEDFALRRESREEGYNAAIGSLWWVLHRPADLRRDVLATLATQAPSLPFFATPETHNTPRCAARWGGAARSRALWTFATFLPGIPFVHGGFELGETTPVNTGLDFSPEALAQYPAESLPLYAACGYDWSRSDDVLSTVRRCIDVRRAFEDVVCDGTPSSFVPLSTGEDGVLAYERKGSAGRVVVVSNVSGHRANVRVVGVSLRNGLATDRLNGRRALVEESVVAVDLSEWEALVFAEETAA